MKAINILLATLIFSLPAFAGSKSERIEVRKPFGSRTENVKYDGFTIIGGHDVPFGWHERIIKNLKIIKKNAPDMYKLAQKRAWKIQFNTTGYSAAAPWKNLIGIGRHDFNHPAQYGNLTSTLIHEFMHCNPIDGSHGPVWWAEYRYSKRCGVHPYLLGWYKANATAYGWNEERWNRMFPNWK